MPENPSDLHVVGRTADGRVWHGIRSPTAGWTPFGDVLAQVGLAGQVVVDVACARKMQLGGNDGLYVFLAFAQGPPRLLFRNADVAGPGQWTQAPVPPFPAARQVGVGVSFAVSQSPSPPAGPQVHTAVVTDDGVLMAAVQGVTGAQPVLPTDVEAVAGELGELRGVSVVGMGAIDPAIPTVSVLLTVDSTGRIFETSGGGETWSPFVEHGPAGSGAPARPGDVVAAAAAQVAGEWNYVIATGDGRAWWTRRTSAGWRPWLDLETTPTTITGPGIVVTTTTTVNVGTFGRITAGATTEGLHVLGTTTDGRVWHQIRSSTGPVFRDVEAAMAMDFGRFTTVACA